MHEGRVSPDGTLIAAHRVIEGKEQLTLYKVADGSLVRALPGDPSGGFQWTPDGSALIASMTGKDGLDNLERIPIDGSPRTPISRFTATDRLFLLSVSADGRIAFSRGSSDNDVVLLTVGK